MSAELMGSKACAPSCPSGRSSACRAPHPKNHHHHHHRASLSGSDSDPGACFAVCRRRASCRDCETGYGYGFCDACGRGGAKRNETATESENESSRMTLSDRARAAGGDSGDDKVTCCVTASGSSSKRPAMINQCRKGRWRWVGSGWDGFDMGTAKQTAYGRLK